MALIQNTGKTSLGAAVPIPVGGLVASSSTPLAANGMFATDILPYNGNDSIHFSIMADQLGTYQVEYYKGGNKINFITAPVTFDPAVVMAFQGALAGKGDAFRLIYRNGSVAQTAFYMEVRFSDTAQQTFRSLGIPASSTNMAGTTHAVIEGRVNGTGNYNQVTATPNASKIAMDVNVVNQAGSYETAGVGSISDAPVTDQTKPGSVIALLKGLLAETIAPATTGTFTAISLSANVQQTIAANPNRKQLIISSVSGTILIAIGFNATASNWSYRIVTNGTVEIDEVQAPVSVSLFSTSTSTVNVTQII